MAASNNGIDIVRASRPGGVPTHVVSAPSPHTPMSPNFLQKPVFTAMPRATLPFQRAAAGAKALLRKIAR